MFEINTAVRINDPASFYHGKTAVIREAHRFGDVEIFTVDIKTDGAVVSFALRDSQFEVERQMPYRIVYSIEGRMTSDTTTDIFAWMEARGRKHTGDETSASRRQELQGQPKFDGFAGPMWDGDAIRYEDWQAYERLSA